MTKDQAISLSVRTLTYAYGLVLILIGLDKVTQLHLITDWAKYVSPLALSLIPLSANAIVTALGVAEIVVGICLFFWRRAMAYVIIAVLLVIIVDLFSLGLYDIAARDALIALGALVLSWLVEARHE
jgi:hypothetical protein